MKKNISIIILTISTMMMVGCAITEVSPLPYDPMLKKITLHDNPKTTVPDFQAVLEENFNKHGIAVTRAAEFAQVGDDEYSIRYSASQLWDIATFMSSAFVTIYKGGKQVATARYERVCQGLVTVIDFDPTKYNPPAINLRKMYDELLKNYPAQMPPISRK